MDRYNMYYIDIDTVIDLYLYLYIIISMYLSLYIYYTQEHRYFTFPLSHFTVELFFLFNGSKCFPE